MASPQVPSATVRFGVFEADLRSGELRKGGVKIRIQEMPFRALTLFLSRPGDVVSRDELRQALWPEGVFVDFEQGISSAVRRLRDALGDSADNPVFIETIERRGYRWIAPVHLPAPVSPAHEAESQDLGKEAEKKIAQPSPRRFSVWRRLIFVLPIAVLGFVALTFRPDSRSASAGAKSRAVPTASLHKAANREAEDYYLKGRFFWNKRTPESLNQAVDSFTQAIVHDPNYADAYVGLADCYNLLREYTAMPANEAYPRAFAAAKKAVELDPLSSQAHASLAFASFYGMWDAVTADAEFRRAVELDPNNAIAHHWYATYLEAVRRFDESLREIDRAQALDPNSSSILADKGMLLWRAGRRDDALRLLRQLEQAEPDSVSPHRYLRFAYLDSGEYAGYLSEVSTEARLQRNDSLAAIAGAAQKGFTARGARGMLEDQVAEQKNAFAQGKLSPFFVAQSYSLLGNTQQAIQYLQICMDRREEGIVNIATDPAFNNLHSLPAFQQLLAKAGLPPVN